MSYKETPEERRERLRQKELRNNSGEVFKVVACKI